MTELGLEPLELSPRYTELPEVAEELNERTRETKRLARRAESVCRVSLLAGRIESGAVSRTLTGRVSGIAERAGVFVEVDCCEGLLGARRLGGKVNSCETIWHPAKGRAIRLGDELRVRIRRVDQLRGQLDLERD